MTAGQAELVLFYFIYHSHREVVLSCEQHFRKGLVALFAEPTYSVASDFAEQKKYICITSISNTINSNKVATMIEIKVGIANLQNEDLLKSCSSFLFKPWCGIQIQKFQVGEIVFIPYTLRLQVTDMTFADLWVDSAHLNMSDVETDTVTLHSRYKQYI